MPSGPVPESAAPAAALSSGDDTPDVCGTAGAAKSAASCCGGAATGAGCGLSALRRGSGPRPTVTVAEERTIPAAAGSGEAAGTAAVDAGSTGETAGTGGAGRVEWLLADSVWWGGRLRSGVALRVAPDGVIKPVPAELAPGGTDTRRFPGTLLPGLVDAHVHSALVDLGTVRAGGIAEVWDLGGVPAQVSDLAARARKPGVKLPRIRYAGPFLIAPGGYPSDRSWAADGSWREIHTAADAGTAVAEARQAGATLIKVTAHTGGPTLPQPILAALVSSAHESGLPVVVHAEGAGTVAAAHTAGADMLAHTPWTERVDDELLRACAQHMQWISTLDMHGWGDPDPAREIAVDNLRRFISYGGVVRYGTDLGNGPLPLGVNIREIRLLQSAGLTPDAVLTAMTESDSTTVVWIAGGLNPDPAAFAGSVATARVLDADVRPRPL